ncbi:MAG TPA: hydroxyisourate hydrolase [Acetobacteraceae bacterium]|nr:hydroxyisourate hydrolase [Acetobacteraceae bacterium]
MGWLSTHVLDVANGRPAGGIRITLRRADDGALLAEVVTNADGRTAAPLLQDEALQAGRYELRFEAGAYFRAQGLTLPDPAFLDEVVIRFGVADPAAHYHVPLLLSPWSYSTYRGS